MSFTRVALSLLAACLLMAPAAQAEGWLLEAGSGFAYVYPHPQLKLGYRLPGAFELALGWSPGINNFDTWSQTLWLQGKYRLELLPGLAPFAALDAGCSVFALDQAWQTRPFVGFGLGLDWLFLPAHGLGLSTGLRLLLPDPYSNAPFVFRPELNLRWLF